MLLEGYFIEDFGTLLFIVRCAFELRLVALYAGLCSGYFLREGLGVLQRTRKSPAFVGDEINVYLYVFLSDCHYARVFLFESASYFLRHYVRQA